MLQKGKDPTDIIGTNMSRQLTLFWNFGKIQKDAECHRKHKVYMRTEDTRRQRIIISRTAIFAAFSPLFCYRTSTPWSPYYPHIEMGTLSAHLVRTEARTQDSHTSSLNAEHVQVTFVRLGGLALLSGLITTQLFTMGCSCYGEGRQVKRGL